MTIWAIKDFGTEFRLSQNDRSGQWGKLPIPIRFDNEHYVELMETSKGRDAYCVFIGLAGFSANLPTRGILADKHRRPVSEGALEAKIRIPRAAIRRAIAILSADPPTWLLPAEWRDGWYVLYRGDWVPFIAPPEKPRGRPSADPYSAPSAVPSAVPLGAPCAVPSAVPSAVPDGVPSASGTRTGLAEAEAEAEQSRSASVSKTETRVSQGARASPPTGRGHAQPGLPACLPACLPRGPDHLPADAPLRDVLAACGVEAPNLDLLARSPKLSPLIVRAEWAQIMRRGDALNDPTRVLVRTLERRAGIRLKGRMSSVGDLATAYTTATPAALRRLAERHATAEIDRIRRFRT